MAKWYTSTMALRTCGSCGPRKDRGTHRLPHRPVAPQGGRLCVQTQLGRGAAVLGSCRLQIAVAVTRKPYRSHSQRGPSVGAAWPAKTSALCLQLRQLGR